MMLDINLAGYLAHSPEKRIQAIIIFSIFALQYVFEHILPARKKINDGKNEMRNIGIGIANLILLFIPSMLVIELLTVIENRSLGLLWLFDLPFSFSLLLTIFIMDFFMYWWHRFNHTVKIFWRFHRFHHQDEKMNTTTTLRIHTVELLFSSVFKALFFLVMGFSFLPVLIYEILFFIVVVIHHSNISISTAFDMQYRKIFSSPLMHRIHHSAIREETDTNYGSVFSFWDRLFSTYKKDAKGEIVFGVDETKR